MTPTYKYLTPIIGTKGVYSFSHDFKVTAGEILICTANRTLSDYIANNETPFEDIYQPAGLTESDYQSDLDINIEIVSLLNDGGYIYRIPARFIASYPIQDGIGYHAVTIPVALPAIPVDQDLTSTIQDIKAAVKSSLGVDSVASVVQTSIVRAADAVTYERIQTERQMVIDDNISVYAELSQKDQEIASLKQRIDVLEAFIIANNP